MKFVLAGMLVFSELAAQRPIDGREQEKRLITEMRPVVSPGCAGLRVVPVQAFINEQGQVVKVKKHSQKVVKAVPEFLWSLAAAAVKKLHYRPLLVGGVPTAVKTVVDVPCQQ